MPGKGLAQGLLFHDSRPLSHYHKIETLSHQVSSLVAQMVKHLPTVLETRVRSLGWEDPLEKEMATHSSILPGKSHGWRNLVGTTGLQRVGHN